MKKVSNYVRICLVLMLLGISIFTTGCGKEDLSYSETLVLSVDHSKIYMDEMMYHVMIEEMYGQLYASFVGSGDNYWDMKNEDGITMREASKINAMNNAIKYELFYQLAMEENYTLTDEEKEISKLQSENILKNVQPQQLQTTELTDDKLTKIQDKIAIATKYYEEYLKKLEIDEENIKEGFQPEDYKQYDIQYIYANKKQYESLSTLLEVVSSTEDITTLTKGTELTSGKLSFLEGENTFGEETNLENVIKEMTVNEVSDIVETVKGYYILKLTNNTSTKLYDAAISEAMKKAVEEVFEPAYDALKKEHKIKINDKVWDRIDMGSATINPEGSKTNEYE